MKHLILQAHLVYFFIFLTFFIPPDHPVFMFFWTPLSSLYSLNNSNHWHPLSTASLCSSAPETILMCFLLGSTELWLPCSELAGPGKLSCWFPFPLSYFESPGPMEHHHSETAVLTEGSHHSVCSPTAPATCSSHCARCFFTHYLDWIDIMNPTVHKRESRLRAVTNQLRTSVCSRWN